MGHLEVQPPQVSVSRMVKNFCQAEFVKSEILLLGFIAALAKATDYNYSPLPGVGFLELARSRLHFSCHLQF